MKIASGQAVTHVQKKLRGAITAVITPFKPDGSVDFYALESLIDWQINNGISGIVVCGSTGEAHTLTQDEYYSVIENSVAIVKNRVPLIAGTGSNSTSNTIKLTKFAHSAGVNFVMVVAPYYNRPHQDGIIEHFRAVSKAVDIGIIAYNVPSRTSVDIEDSSMVTIAELPNVIGIKDATSNMYRVQNLRHMLSDDISLLSGDDHTSLAFNLYGGDGAISVVSNVAPKKFSEMQNASLNGDFQKATKLNNELFKLNCAIAKTGTNPIPIKYALSLVHEYISDTVRLPLTQLNSESKEIIKTAVAQFRGK